MKNVSTFLRFVVLALVAVFLAGCSRDPNVRKQKYLESGERYFAKDQFAAAAIQFSNAIQVDPQYAAAHYQLARTRLRLQDWPSAYKELARTVELAPENYQARLAFANLLVAAGDLKQAQEQVDVLLVKQPGDPQVHVAIASLRAAQNDFPVAIQELQNAIAIDPSKGEPHLALALIQLKTGRLDSAEINFKRAVELAPQTIDARLALGSYYESRQRFADAEQQFRGVIAIDRQDPGPRVALVRLYMAEDKKADAEEFLKQGKKDLADNPVGYRMLGDFYFAAGDFDKATEEYRMLNAQHPDDLQVKKNYVQLLILRNRLDEAGKLNDAVLKIRPNDVDSLIERGQIQVNEGHPSNAVETLRAAIKNDPDNALAYYHLGIAFDRMGNDRQAESAWQDAVRRRPGLVEAQRALAAAALRNGNMPELEQSSSQVVNLQPTSPDGYALRAVSYLSRGQLSRAEPDVLKAINVAPESPVGYLQMGNLRLAQKNYREAERAYREAMHWDGNSSDALAGLIRVYLAQNQTANALSAVRAQINSVGDNSVFYDLLGTTLFNNKKSPQDHDEAQASLEKSVQIDQHNLDAWLKLSQVQAARGLTDEAISTCQRAIANNPGKANLYVLAGQLYESKQDWDRAKEAYQKALGLDPQHPLASNNLAYVMLQTGGNPDLAMSLAEIARRGMPDSPQAADTVGWVFFQRGAYKSAIEMFQEALKLAEKRKSPDNPTVHFHLGLAYEKTGQPDLARQHLQRVLKINPNYSSADDVKKILSQLHS